MEAFDFDVERKRLSAMIEARGIETCEDIVLTLSLAVLDYAQAHPEKNKKAFTKYVDALDKAKFNLRRARVLGDL